MKQKLLEMVQVTVFFHTDELIFVCSFKNGNGRVPRLSSRVTLATSRRGPAWSEYVLQLQKLYVCDKLAVST